MEVRKKRGRPVKRTEEGAICFQCQKPWDGKTKPKGNCCNKACYDRMLRANKKTRLECPLLESVTGEVLLQEEGDFVMVWKGVLRNGHDLLPQITKEITFPERPIIQHGINVLEPRFVIFMGDEGSADMKYSGITRSVSPWTPTVLKLKEALGGLLEQFPRQPKEGRLNVALVNYYPRGRFYMGLHNDDNVAMGSDPLILSAVLGCERPFIMQELQGRKRKIETTLPMGSVVLMLGWSIQSKWKHGVPRDDSIAEERLNISFRFHLQQKQVKQVQNVRKLTSPQLPLLRVLKALDY
jgi:alkylated DNA repair dioxygenase AlkB